MKVLITGATGLIGREVGRELAQRGHAITVVSRRPERARSEIPFPARVFSWAGSSEDFPEEALVGQDVIIHLAGESIADGRWTKKRKQAIYESRVTGTKRLVDAVSALKLKANAGPIGISPAEKNVEYKLRAFICGTAIGLYGERGDEVLNESAMAGAGFLANTVRDWEKEASDIVIDAGAHHANGGNDITAKPVRFCIVRTGVVLSKRGGAFAKMLPIFQSGIGGKLGDGKQWLSWIHIDDLVEIFVRAVENDSFSGVVNGTAPNPVTNAEFTRTVAECLGQREFPSVPKTILKIVLGEMASAVLASTRTVPERLLKLGFTFRFPTLTTALNDLCLPYKGGSHELFAEQWVPRTPSEVFPYFSSETNLEELTPPFLGFKVLGKSTPAITEGTLIDYKMNIHGVPVKWRTRIDTWQPDVVFVDTQLRGPYAKWHHTHSFIPLGGGTLLRDQVIYKLPLGWAGDLVAGGKVSRDVATIFAYRRKKIDEMWASPGNAVK